MIVDMNYSKEFNDLLNNAIWNKNEHFVGYGNPDATILVIGKECAIDINSEWGKKGYEEEYLKNFYLWQKQISKGEIINWIENPKLEWSIFHPRAPFYGQRFVIEKRNKDGEIISGKGGTSSTWYNYQKLINIIREQGKLSSQANITTIDFYEDCFITELNELCRPNDNNMIPSEKQMIKDNIRNRFDLMKATNSFWSHFQTVILACGPYADALRADKQLLFDIFGDANVISMVEGRKIPQLSICISDHLLEEIANQV